MFLASDWMTPFFILINSAKLESAVESVASCANVSDILSRWAPWAAKLFEPLALSKSVSSSLGVISCSLIVNPTRVVRVVDAKSNTNVCANTLTNCPRI